MKQIILDRFLPDRGKVLEHLKCPAEGELHERMSAQLTELENTVTLSPKIYLETVNEGGKSFIYVLITLGEAISAHIKRCFDEGEFLAGLMSDSWADEALFAADTRAAQLIREECALMGKGIAKRLEGGVDLPIEFNRKLLAAMGEIGVGITDAFMYVPAKTMAYVLELSEDEGVFKAQHDCSKCPNLNCPRRTVPLESMDSVSEHGEVAVSERVNALCIDIGTTTIAAERLDGAATAVYTAVNRQRRFGADVISRIEASNRGRGRELQSIILRQINEAIDALYPEKLPPEQILISANTTMVQLLLGCSCLKMGAYPFEVENKAYTETEFLYRGRKVPMRIIPSVSAFVGGDIVSGLYSCDFDLSDELNLFVDLGTNGEMALGRRGKILVSSTAAGPAFEGGRISCGTGSCDGAVCSVSLKKGEIKTINGAPAYGICGTGIVELVAEMLDSGIIDETGLLRDEYFDGGFEFADGLRFTQGDIREVQTAKAAVRAGIETLMSNFGCKYDEIGTVYIAGGFGYRLDIDAACRIGLVPAELARKCVAVGNSSLGGAVRLAAEHDFAAALGRMDAICGMCREVSLALDAEFEERYVGFMGF